MFWKLLKHDFRAVGRFWWIGAVVSVVASICAAVLFRFFWGNIGNESEDLLLELISVCTIFMAFICIFAVALSFVFTLILVYTRFYKNFFTDEGYLTFTLPVKRSTLFFSKIVNATAWYSLHIAVLIVSALLFSLLVLPAEPSRFFINFYVFELVGELFAFLWQLVGAWLIAYIFEILLLAFVYMLYSILLVHFCITVGAVLAKKAKILLSIGIYYLISSVTQVLSEVVVIFGSSFVEAIINSMKNASEGAINAISALFIFLAILALAALGAMFYFVTNHLLHRKLNLS